MVYNNYSFIIFTLLLVINFIFGSKNCKIKVAKNKLSFAKNNEDLIYNEGVLNLKYLPNSKEPYVTSNEDHIEYFYILEDILTYPHDNHEQIVK